MGLKELHKEFLEYLEIEKNRALKTVENYDRYLKRFFDFAKISEPQDINEEIIRKYRLYLNRLEWGKNEHLKKQTQSYHLIALRHFLKYLAKRDVKTYAPEKIELGKTQSRQVEFLENEELVRLLEAASGKDLKTLRDRAILELLFSTGLRVSELCSLNRDSLNLKRDEFPIRGKGGKIRLVFLSENAKNSLKEYLDKRTDINEALFVSSKKEHTRSARRGHARTERGQPQKRTENSTREPNQPGNQEERLTSRSVQRMFKKYALAAGIAKKVSPHTMRHSFGTDLLRAGADLRSVQALLGHSSITTTQIYTHITDKSLKEVHKKYHGKQ